MRHSNISVSHFLCRQTHTHPLQPRLPCLPRPLQRWRRYSNARFVDLDKLWTIGMFFAASKIYATNWRDVSLAALIIHQGIAITLFSILLLWLQFKHTDFYNVWRVPLVMGARLSREACVIFFLRKSVHLIRPVAPPGAQDSCLWLGFPGRNQVIYTISRSLAYPLPFKLQLPSLAFAMAGTLPTLTERCLAYDVADLWLQ